MILPFTVLRRIDAVLEPTKQAVLERKKLLDSAKVANQNGALQAAAGQAFYNVSEFTLAKLKASAAGQRLREDFIAYLDGFSPNVQEVLTKFNFRNQIQKLVDAHILGYLIEDFLDPEVNLSPLPVKDADGRTKLPALDNHGMGTVFEELIRRFNEENNEEAGEHFTRATSFNSWPSCCSYQWPTGSSPAPIRCTTALVARAACSQWPRKP